MSRTQLYRQQPGDFRKRIEQILRGRHAPGSRRVHLDTTGTRTWRVPFRTVEEHLKLYGEARHLSVARILALFQIVRQVEGLGASTHRVRVEATGALWQAYQGTTDFNACHTCPTLVLLDGQLPSQVTRNRGLQRHIVLEFSDCMLMPRAVNEVDMLVDEVVGREAFVSAVDHVLNGGADWRQGVETFREGMSELLGPIGEALLFPQTPHFQLRDPADQHFLDVLSAYWEGLYLHDVTGHAMQNFVLQVRNEMGIP